MQSELSQKPKKLYLSKNDIDTEMKNNTSKYIKMKSTLKIVISAIAITLIVPNYSFARTGKSEATFHSHSRISIAYDGPFDELVALFNTYIEKISSVADESQYNETKNEFQEKLSELSELYPNYEPTSSELKIIEELFAKFEEERTTTTERLEISEYVEEEDSEEIKMYDEEEVDSLVSYYSSIEDPVEAVTTLLNDFSEKFDSADNIISVYIIYSTFEAVSENLEEVMNDKAVEKMIEDESSDLYKSLIRFQQSVETTINKVAPEGTEDIEDVEDVELE